MNLFPRRSYFLLASLNYLMNLFPRRSYFLLASLNYLMNMSPRRSYFLLASLNYLMNLSPRRSYFLLASLPYLRNVFLVGNPRIQKSGNKNTEKKQESIGKNARPRNQAFVRFRNLRMPQLDFHPITKKFRKECLYNKALATTLEGSRKFLGGTSARSGCDETGPTTKFDDILEKYRRSTIHERARE